MSQAQERLWLSYLLDPQSNADNLCLGWRMRGVLDASAMREALNGLLTRHEPLRTTFAAVDDYGVQVVQEARRMNLTSLDLSGFPKPDQASELDAILAAAAREPFDLRTGPLFRAQLVRLGPSEHVLVLAVHHIVADGWSMGVLCDDLSALYAAAHHGESPLLVPLERQFSEIAAQQRQQESDDSHAAQIAYWRDCLRGFKPLELRTDYKRTDARTGPAQVQNFEIAASDLGRLLTLSRQHRCTLFMSLVALTQLLFARYSGLNDVCIGTAAHGRRSIEEEQLIGFFVNTLALRCKVSEDLSFSEFLARARATVIEAFAHQDVPFEKIVQALHPPRRPGQVPIVPVMVLLQNASTGHLWLDGVSTEEVLLPPPSIAFEMCLEFREHNGNLQGTFIYRGDLYQPTTIARMAAHFTSLASALVSSPAVPMAQIRDLDRAQSPHRANRSTGTNATHSCTSVHEAFIEHALKTPHALAVVQGGQRLTYADINARSSQFAWRLKELEVRRGAAVAVFLDRSVDFVISVLGILKADAAYVPLDPSYPDSRLAFMLDGLDLVMIITNEELRGRIPDVRVRKLSLDRDYAQIESMPRHAPPIGVTAKDLAYILFTSGSTGAPKGVMVEHQALSNVIAQARRLLSLSATSRVLQFLSMSFDGGPWDIFTTLTSGATLFLANSESRSNPLSLTEQIRADQVTALTLSPSLLAKMEPREIPSVEVVCAAGEVCPPELVKKWGDGRRVFNVYGPTETAIALTMFHADPTAAYSTVPVGAPLENVHIYILNEALSHVPIGVVGELYAAGVQLARGYSHHAALTAERFVANPFSTPGERMYRTGDLACWREDGTIEFVGRADNQVKVRGFRVEPEEVEATLRRHPAVADVAILMTNGRLHAYIVLSDRSSTPENKELREFVGRALPDYYIPAEFIFLDALPLNPNGKTDRNALTGVARQALSRRTLVPPLTEIEAMLARIWAEILGLERVGTDENFFDLGGDSILGMEVVARIRRAGLSVPLRQMYLEHTVASLAQEISGGSERQRESMSTGGTVILGPVQRWFLQAYDLDTASLTQSVHLELASAVDGAALAEALASLVAHHDALRMRFHRDSAGEWVQNIDPVESGKLLDLVEPSTHQSSGPAALLDSAARKAKGSLSPRTGPLIKAVLYTPPRGGRQRLFITAHHLVVDAVSWRILLDDLSTAYGQARRGLPATLGPKTTSFGTWTHRLQEYADSGGFDAEIGYWSDVEREMLSITAPPADLPGINTNQSIECVTEWLSYDDTNVLLRDTPALYRTRINDVLITALCRVTAEWTGNDRTALSIEGHGREDLFPDVDLTRTVGWFTTEFPVVFIVPPSRSWETTVSAIRRQLRAIPRNGIGHGALRYLSSKPFLSQPARTGPYISFNYLGQFDSVVSSNPFIRRLLRPLGSDHAETGERPKILDFVCLVLGGRLRISCYYSSEVHREETIHQLLVRYRSALSEISSQAADSVLEQHG